MSGFIATIALNASVSHLCLNRNHLKKGARVSAIAVSRARRLRVRRPLSHKPVWTVKGVI